MGISLKQVLWGIFWLLFTLCIFTPFVWYGFALVKDMDLKKDVTVSSVVIVASMV
jgi:hypothetical protein